VSLLKQLSAFIKIKCTFVLMCYVSLLSVLSATVHVCGGCGHLLVSFPTIACLSG